MQSSCNYIHMFCYIQTHRHTSTSSYENVIKHKSYHTSCYACHTSIFFVFYCWCRRALNPLVLDLLWLLCALGLELPTLFLMPWGFISINLSLALPRYFSTLILNSALMISFYAHAHHISHSSWSCYHIHMHHITLYVSLFLFKYIMKT
jgi:hypothetical protein